MNEGWVLFSYDRQGNKSPLSDLNTFTSMKNISPAKLFQLNFQLRDILKTSIDGLIIAKDLLIVSTL